LRQPGTAVPGFLIPPLRGVDFVAPPLCGAEFLNGLTRMALRDKMAWGGDAAAILSRLFAIR
jgi:hypothetical protein